MNLGKHTGSFSVGGDFDAYAAQQNLGRIKYFALVLIFFLLSRLLRGQPSAVETGVMAALLVLSLVYVLAGTLLYRRILARSALARLLCILFWLITTLLLSWYFIRDIRTPGVPVTAALLGASLLIIAVMSRREAAAVFGAYIAYNLLLALAHGADASYCLDLVTVLLPMPVLYFLIQYEYVKTMSDLRQMARNDPLTGILNRKGGLDKMSTVLELCKRHSETAAVYMIDIDDFKKYNDAHGHLAGDEALRRVVGCIRGVFSRASDVVCRYGGEEFLTCASVTDLDAALTLANDLLLSVAGCRMRDAPDAAASHLTVSVGYTLYSPASHDLTAGEMKLIGMADTALYRAKACGKNHAVLMT